MNIVIDTNVIVSAALSPNGNPGEIIKLIADSEGSQRIPHNREFETLPRRIVYHDASILFRNALINLLFPNERRSYQ
jgi:predicted nucleic acid-binding protein